MFSYPNPSQQNTGYPQARNSHKTARKSILQTNEEFKGDDGIQNFSAIAPSSSRRPNVLRTEINEDGIQVNHVATRDLAQLMKSKQDIYSILLTAGKYLLTKFPRSVLSPTIRRMYYRILEGHLLWKEESKFVL